MDRLPRVSAFVLATVLATVGTLAVGPVPKATASPAATGDFSGLVDIGGRSLYLECRGQGSPTVILESGAGGRADVWSRDLVVRLYASEYPDEVVGMVLLDSTHEDVWLRFQEALAPDLWAAFEALTVTNQDLLDAYPEAERWYTAPLADDVTTGQVRQARKDAPLRPMPLVVLAHGIPFADPFPGWPSDKMEGIMFALQQDLAQLVPDARLIIATESGHNIHQDQPQLVIDAIRQVVAAVRDPSAWAAPVASPGG